jgi:ribonuclease HI
MGVLSVISFISFFSYFLLSIIFKFLDYFVGICTFIGFVNRFLSIIVAVSSAATIKASKKLVSELGKLGVQASVQEVKNNEWLAKILTPYGPLALYTNAKGKVTVQLNFISDAKLKKEAAAVLDRLHARAMVHPIDDKTYIAYTDGSAQGGQCGWSMVLFNSTGKKEFEKYGNLGPQPNGQIAGEVEGAICAIQDALKHSLKRLLVRHDYEGVGKWGTGTWRNKDDDATRLKRWVAYSKTKGLGVSFQWTKGHNGDAGNERADFLAGQATTLPPLERLPDPPDVIKLRPSEQIEFGI